MHTKRPQSKQKKSPGRASRSKPDSFNVSHSKFFPPLLIWKLFAVISRFLCVRTFQSQFVCRRRRLRSIRCSSSCHSSHARLHIVPSSLLQYIYIYSLNDGRSWFSVYSVHVNAAQAIRFDAWLPNGDNHVSDDLFKSVRTNANRTLHTHTFERLVISTPFYILFLFRFGSMAAAAFAWHERGTYVVENFDEIFMLKLKTLSTSTDGMKKKILHFVIYFSARSSLVPPTGRAEHRDNIHARTIH